jgi:prepilin-type N-terminal cleavage/methylation domain-containing protein
MCSKTQPNRSGFTLVEILVVVVIIAILAGLATPAVLRALRRTQIAGGILELNTLAQAVEAYRNEYGAYPPDFTDSQAVLNHLNRSFPRRQELTDLAAVNNLILNQRLGPSRALAFWLRGFYSNPEYPIFGTPDPNDPSQPPQGELQPLIEINVKMISGGDGDLETLDPNEFLVPTRGQPAPFVYFNSSSCDGCSNPYEMNEPPVRTKFVQISGSGEVRPYMSAKTNKFVNHKTFQIISAGMDGKYGDYSDPNEVKWHGSGANFDLDDRDNIANFSETTLEDAIE